MGKLVSSWTSHAAQLSVVWPGFCLPTDTVLFLFVSSVSPTGVKVCGKLWMFWRKENEILKEMKRAKLKEKFDAKRKSWTEEENRVAGFGRWLPFKLLQHQVKMYFYNVSRMRNLQSGGTSAPGYVSVRTLKRLCKELCMFWANHLGRNCLLWRRSWRISEEAEVIVDSRAIVEVCKPKEAQCFTKPMCIWHAVRCIRSIIYCFYQVCSKESLFSGISAIYLILLWLYPGILLTSEVSANLKL